MGEGAKQPRTPPPARLTVPVFGDRQHHPSCRHCADADNPKISREFLAQVFRHVYTPELWHFAEMTAEDLRGTCARCGGETSRLLRAFILEEGNRRWRP